MGKGDVLIGGVILTRRAALLSPHLAQIANNGRLGLDERIEAAMSAEVMAVALSQPGRDCGVTSDALATFCVRLRPEMFMAGEAYDWEVRAEKSARGFYVIDQEKGRREGDLSPEQIDAMNEEAIQRLAETNAVLRAIADELPRRMELLCYDRLPWSTRDKAILRDGLAVLMEHYGLLDKGINRDKP